MISLVYFNRGRWVVECPKEECGWAYQAMTPEGAPRYAHFCTGDQNGRGCGTRIDLVWPSLEEALEIENAMFKRLRNLNRNWFVEETVDGLLAENDNYLVGWTVGRLADKGMGVI